MIEELAKATANFNAKDRWGGTPLNDAIREGHLECASKIADLGGRLDLAEGDAASKLCELAHGSKMEELKIMLKSGVNANACDYDGRTCLHLAASEGNQRIVEELLLPRWRVKIDAKDRWGGTPLTDALRGKHVEIARLLRKAGGTLGYDEVTASGELCESAKSGKLETLELLLEA